MAYTIDLLGDIRHRYMALATVHSMGDKSSMPDIMTLFDTGAFNTMIDIDHAKKYGAMLNMPVPVVIGGHSGIAEGCILWKVSFGDFHMERVFALAYPFEDWLSQHIIIGTNVTNNWEYMTSRTKNIITLEECVPADAPNQIYPYQNYFRKGKYIAVQDDFMP